MRPETIRELERVNLRLRAIAVELDVLPKEDPHRSALLDEARSLHDDLVDILDVEFERMPFFKWMFFVVVREVATTAGWLMGRLGAPARWLLRVLDSFR